MKKSELMPKNLRWIVVDEVEYFGEIEKKQDGTTVVHGVEGHGASAIREWFTAGNADELETIELVGQYSAQIKSLNEKEMQLWNKHYAQLEYVKSRALALWENKVFEDMSER